MARASTFALPVSSRRSFLGLAGRRQTSLTHQSVEDDGRDLRIFWCECDGLRDVNCGVLMEIAAETLKLCRQGDEQRSVEMQGGALSAALPTGHFAVNIFEAIQHRASLRLPFT